MEERKKRIWKKAAIGVAGATILSLGGIGAHKLYTRHKNRRRHNHPVGHFNGVIDWNGAAMDYLDQLSL